MPGSGFRELMGLQWEERKNKRGSKIRGVIRCLGAPFPPAEGDLRVICSRSMSKDLKRTLWVCVCDLEPE